MVDQQIVGRQAVYILLVVLRVVSSQTAIDGCIGTADNCATPHNYTVSWSEPIHLVCQGSGNVSRVSWSINGLPVRMTGEYTVYYPADDPLHRFIIQEQPGLMGSDINVWLKGYAIPTAVHNFRCSSTSIDGEHISTSYSICVVGNSADFLGFQPDSSWTEDKIDYARPGSSLTLQCSFYFGSAATPYNYSISWAKVGGGNEAWSYGHRNDCSAVGDRIYEYNLTVVKAANSTEEQYVCTITKTSLWDPRKTSNKTRRFYIRTQQQLTPAEIGGVSSSSAIVVALIVYLSWRFSIPLRCFVHHMLNLRRHQLSGATAYDALVSFNEDSQLASITAYKEVQENVENEWKYRLCFPQRDFVPGDDMAQSLVEVIDKCQKCIFIIDSAFFDCRWCLTALHYAMKCHHKIIALILMDKSEIQLHTDQIEPIAKVGVLINWRTDDVKQSLLKRLFVPHYRWTSLKLRLPPKPISRRSLLKFWIW